MTIDEAIEELHHTIDYYPGSEPASDEALEMAIKALKTLDKIYKACERYEKQGDNYFGYIKICVAKDIAKEIMPKQAVCESCVHWKPLIYKPGAQAVGCELALMGCPYEPKTKGSDKE